ncbi:MAG TPA: nuclear transport factor 2 family protein [Allosphingosinicella sp.]|nr:nuclear transport factor 2 family protein [Allosphingosinicella sp.]
MKRQAIGLLLAVALAAPAAAGAGMQDNAPAAAPDGAAETPGAARLQAEAAAFMEAYGRELAAGDFPAIARRYHRGGAWRVGAGESRFETYAEIAAFYAGEQWTPASFAWRDLAYEPVGPDAVVVTGLFQWGRRERGEPLLVAYTGLLVRQDGELRIRLEHESEAP